MPKDVLNTGIFRHSLPNKNKQTYFKALNLTRLGLAASSPKRLRLSASYSL